MSTSLSNARNCLQVACVFVKDDVNNCDCDVPTKEQICWKLTNPTDFLELQQQLGFIQTRLRKCDYFEWKNVALEDGCYKNLFYSMKQQTKNVELEFLLSKEKSLLASMEKGMCDSKKSIHMYKLLVVVLVVGYLIIVGGEAFGVAISVRCMYWDVKVICIFCKVSLKW
uniref:Uncharacterized protein n=1 Tax=Lactuca sativa TaxID=4236 RepID=A0A9R1V2B3_LACSA|nr:hypothetical protein LSAT_V11C700348780 [Lactuca sativa]